METEFLSTLSLRRATDIVVPPAVNKAFLSTLSLRRATLCRVVQAAPGGHFYPRSPCGERPLALFLAVAANIISIHALLAESDDAVLQGGVLVECISIHALLAESDDGDQRSAGTIQEFLSTLSLRRATALHSR